eukprot:TRINITY_DN2566_c0_g1_i4.p1 TRINITY_DN2566_c0_g1~~TRINITY_DN2566_c0_g1_i4.p1  ORF type:complete len:197 (+),score=28.73 TRINITY_DN2566_c0_g1_i4:292-882(+)
MTAVNNVEMKTPPPVVQVGFPQPQVVDTQPVVYDVVPDDNTNNNINPALSYAALGVIAVGYALVWAGLFVWASGVQNSTGWRFVLAGMITCGVGCAFLFAVIKYQQEAMCKRVMIAFGVLGVLLLVPFLIVLFTTYSYDSSDSDDHDKAWDDFGVGVARTVYTLFGIAVLAVSGCVMGCFCCVLSCKRPANCPIEV